MKETGFPRAEVFGAAWAPIFCKLCLLFKATRFDNAAPVKTLLNFRLGNSSWSLSFGEYVCLVVAVLGGGLAGCATSRQSVAARSAPTYQTTGGTNAPGINPGADRRLASE